MIFGGFFLKVKGKLPGFRLKMAGRSYDLANAKFPRSCPDTAPGDRC